MGSYNANVRIGNWYYELILQEEKAKQYMRRSKNSELKVQKTRKFFLEMLTEVPLTFPVVGLSYGAVVQIVSPDMPLNPLFKVEAKQGIALAADVDFNNVDKRSTFAQGDPVIGTPLMTPCVRNVWTLVPEDKSRRGKELRFGDSFYLQLYKTSPPLYLECPLSAPIAPKGESGHVVPTLTPFINALARFKVVNTIPQLRYETQGTPVPPFEKIAIIQGATSGSLAVEADTWIPTYFGMECEVSVHTFKNMSDPRKPDPRNSWCFILSSA